jgi:hypothetical protein
MGAYRLAAIGALAGFAGGFGAGVWVRLAMRVSGILTEDRNRRILTEADAVVGKATFDGTQFIVLAASFLGIVGGVLFMAIRQWLPASPLVRAVSFSGLMLAIFGFVLLDEHNPDFQLFGPAWLNVGMYGLTYLVYGGLVSVLAERLVARVPHLALRRSAGWRVRLATLALVPVGALGVLSIVGVFVAGAENGAAAIFATMFLLLGLVRIVRIPLRNAWVSAPAMWRAGILSVLIPGLIGFWLTVQGIAGILFG